MSMQVALAELSERRGVSHSELVEEIEIEVDMRLSTLERYIEALGGQLEIHAIFGDEDVKLTF